LFKPSFVYEVFKKGFGREIIDCGFHSPITRVNVIILAKLWVHKTILTEMNTDIGFLETQSHIALICDDIKQLLIEKNKKYGDSALNPSRIFSKSDAVEQILVRIDDKLNRIQKGAGLLANDEDVIMDLMGYLVLLKIALHRQSKT